MDHVGYKRYDWTDKRSRVRVRGSPDPEKESDSGRQMTYALSLVEIWSGLHAFN